MTPQGFIRTTGGGVTTWVETGPPPWERKAAAPRQDIDRGDTGLALLDDKQFQKKRPKKRLRKKIS